jgi:quercetin dioxygenase-like cupin family protein
VGAGESIDPTDIVEAFRHDGREIEEVLYGESLVAVISTLAGGTGISQAEHPWFRVGRVIEGTISLRVAGQESHVRPGEVYCLRPHVPYDERCIGDTPARMADIFIQREDEGRGQAAREGPASMGPAR